MRKDGEGQGRMNKDASSRRGKYEEDGESWGRRGKMGKDAEGWIRMRKEEKGWTDGEG